MTRLLYLSSALLVGAAGLGSYKGIQAWREDATKSPALSATAQALLTSLEASPELWQVDSSAQRCGLRYRSWRILPGAKPEWMCV